MKPLLIIGSTGQLARALKPLYPQAIFLGRAQADLSSPGQLAQVLEEQDPCALINAAAYTQVDKAESEEALAFTINAEAPEIMARFCKSRHIPFVHFSTDYVFDGSGDTPWRESDPTSPLNAYGRSKEQGERKVTAVGGDYLILRTSWVYDASGKNFLNSILRLAGERDELRVIADQFGGPTYAPHLAQGTLALFDAARAMRPFPSGIYHFCNQGVTSWHGFASAIVEQARVLGLPVKAIAVEPIPASDYPLPAKRPFNSRLDCARALSMFGLSLPPWQQGLKEAMEDKREHI